MKKSIYRLLNVSDTRYTASWYVDTFIVALIILNVIALILETVESIRLKFEDFFFYFEIFSVVIFTIEYLLRLWTANLNEKYKKPIAGRFRYAMTPIAMIDLLAILPFYLPFLGIDLRLLRIMRIFRIFRLFKIARYVVAIAAIDRVFKQKREELTITFIFTLFLLLISSTVMYYVEHEAQPDKFSSIPETMWWGIATLTTVGYGDIYPVTSLGRLMGGLIAIIGIGLFALPTGILASGFSDELARLRNKKGYCLTCGRPMPEEKEI